MGPFHTVLRSSSDFAAVAAVEVRMAASGGALVAAVAAGTQLGLVELRGALNNTFSRSILTFAQCCCERGA